MRVSVVGYVFFLVGSFVLDALDFTGREEVSGMPAFCAEGMAAESCCMGFLRCAGKSEALKVQEHLPIERAVVFASAESTKKMLWKRPKASYVASPW
jgi:hypothetical protein